jgi:hypothetical protein
MVQFSATAYSPRLVQWIAPTEREFVACVNLINFPAIGWAIFEKAVHDEETGLF